MKEITERSILRTLGGWRLEIDGAPAAGPGYRKGRALLAYLALEEGWHSREKLGELLAIRNPGHFRQLLSNLRSTLDLPDGTVGLLVERNLLRLNPDYPLWRDTAHFLAPLATQGTAALDELETRLALYDGEYLHGLSLADCPDFESWLEQRRAQLRQQALMLLDQGRQIAETGKVLSRALDYARRMTELDPWSEEAQRQLIRLLALNHNASAALAQYDVCRRMLEKELGVAPAAETEALVAQIRGGDLRQTPAAPARADKERRLLTVLCCDFQLPHSNDVELIAETLGPLRQRCLAKIAAAGGHALPSQGNRLLAYFGYPLARENAARHAVNTALIMVDQADPSLGLRLGIHSGPVIIDAQAGEPDLAGLTSGWALTLAETARPGTVCISGPTHSLVQGYFHCQALGEQQDHQGNHHAVYQVLGETGAATRLQSRTELSPLIGRETELGELLNLWQESRQGRHPSLLLRGDAGIGKSRLVHSLAERLGGEAHELLEMACHPEFCQTPFHPVLTLLSSRFGFSRSDDDQQKRDKIAAYLASVPLGLSLSPAQALELLADVLHLQGSGAPSTLDLPPQQRKEKTCDLLLGLIQHLAQDRPVLLILEDIHWCDPSTLDLLSRHVHRKFGAPILTLITSRPGLIWQGADTILDLQPLSPADTAALVRHLSQDLSDAALDRIIAWSDGIPLFIEEMAKMAPPGQTAAAPDTPLTLQELLAARLEAVGSAKATAQLASALGREFDLELLKRLSPQTEQQVDHDLQHLLDYGLILPLNSGVCQFKHALIQDAAYQSLARSQRQDHHRRIAALLAQADQQDSPPELLARHLTLAGDLLAAIPQWLRAGRWAAQHSANREAADHFEQGLALIAQLPPSEQKVRLEFALQEALGTLRVALLGYGSQGARDCFSRAVELSREVGDDAASFSVMFGLWQGGRSVNLTAAPLEFAARLDQIANASGDPAHRLVTHYAYGNNLFWLARYDEARHHQESALAAPVSVSSSHLIAHYGEDSRILARSFLAWTLWFQGHADQARAQMEQALTEARAARHAHSLGFALTFAGVLYRHIGQPEETVRYCSELGQLAENHGLSLWLAAAATVGGWGRVALGDPDGLPPILAGVAASRIAMRLVEATFRSFQVDAQLRLGQYAEALACAEETIALAESYEDVYLLPELLRLKANAIAALQPEADAQVQALLRQALAKAREQGAPILALRCACDLTSLPAQPPADALSLLAACRGACQEGADTPDLQRADRWLADHPG